MIFKEGAALYALERENRQGEEVIYVNYLSANFVPSIAERADDMNRAVDILSESPQAARIVFVQQRNYNYPFEQVSLLGEIAAIYRFLVKQEAVMSPEKLMLFSGVQGGEKDLSYLINLLRSDPIGCYIELSRKTKEVESILDRAALNGAMVGNKSALLSFLRVLEKFQGMLEESKLIKFAKEAESGFRIGSREIYGHLFRPDILPNFSFTRLVAQLPENAEFIDQYNLNSGVEEVTVTILKKKNETKHFYHILPPEYSLGEEQHMLVNLARNVLSEHRPQAEEFTDPEKTRQVFFNVSRDLIAELAQSKNISLSYKELEKLARILVRYTIGFGLIEILLMDSKLQDIVLNAPIAQNPVFVRHEKYEECTTNIIPSFEDADSWAAKLRLQSGRPLDEANPILDTDLTFGNVHARVAAIKEPLSPQGLAYAFRRHRESPWTLPLFIRNKMLSPFAAGLLSFLIDGSRTLLVAGTRSSGKTSLLGALLLEIMPRYRIISVEDTLELPMDTMRKLGYNVLRMKVRSALVSGSTEIEAADGIRTSLRLGDSALIVGEVRSDEAKALYEAMRVGALANVVAGTIHGDSPYGVFDRVVNDLGVQPTSFKATDLIVVANPVKSADGLHAERRVVRVTEVRKHWQKDPLEEGGFVDLLRYNVETDKLEPTPELINGDSEIIKSIASSVKGWAGNWDAVYDNILLRAKIKEEIVGTSERLNKPALLEAEFIVLSNNVFHNISEKVRAERGLPSMEFVFPEWKKWFLDEVGKW